MMCKMKGSELLVKALEHEGVKRVFGVPGEEILQVLESLRVSKIEFVLTRHEHGAAGCALFSTRLQVAGNGNGGLSQQRQMGKLESPRDPAADSGTARGASRLALRLKAVAALIESRLQMQHCVVDLHARDNAPAIALGVDWTEGTDQSDRLRLPQ